MAESEETVETTTIETEADMESSDESALPIAEEPIDYDGYIAYEECRKGMQIIEAEEAALAYQAELATYFTEEDIIMLAQTIDAEAGAVYPLCRRAAVGWTVVNRLDNGRWGPTTLSGIMSQPGQFAWHSWHGYSETNYRIAEDVLTRWADEHITGERNEGRILDPEYEFFYGDGSQNHFYDSSRNYWDFSVDYDPYANFE